MTKQLSPAAQAAIDAAWCKTPMSPDGPYFTRCRQLAAALRAVAALITMDGAPPAYVRNLTAQRWAIHWIRRWMLAVAEELNELEPEDE